ncbi:ferredoxin reductase [Actinoplanes couchii]|uniref:Oxidoreductase n=1 Tax=Actinoplanes couchii TaxID=403638 RepID=A0ABQ3X0S3_9ACTN|nr:ferredoxin reductase [Actinoplanes couchii]MDR6316379.1 ferredoxin-NADP reductase [Actinoplanes couchii]GID51993.1 oxidoreductase [Actinoplanes couchii]
MPVTQTLRDGAWRVVELITTPVVPADYLDVIAPLRNPTVLRARISDVRPETATAVTLELRPGRGWEPHEPGQYIRVGVDIDGVRLWRAYSVSNAASRKDGRFTITVNAVPDGVVSSYLRYQARKGEIVHLDLPAGDFVLTKPRPAKALFVTAGSGITPVMGMLRSCLSEMPDVVVVHSAKTPEAVVFGAELRELAAAGRIRLIERHTTTEGRLKPAGIAELVPDLLDRETWACGPADLLDDLQEHWSDAGAAERLHVERFRPTVLVAGDGGTVTFEKSGVTTEVPGGTTILDAGEAAGQLMKSGCRMGICFKCVLPMREGIVRDVRDGAITTATEVDGDNVLIQTCVTTAAGPCRFDA